MPGGPGLFKNCRANYKRRPTLLLPVHNSHIRSGRHTALHVDRDQSINRLGTSTRRFQLTYCNGNRHWTGLNPLIQILPPTCRQLHIPGFEGPNVKPYRKYAAGPDHQERTAAVRKARAAAAKSSAQHE